MISLHTKTMNSSYMMIKTMTIIIMINAYFYLLYSYIISFRRCHLQINGVLLCQSRIALVFQYKTCLCQCTFNHTFRTRGPIEDMFGSMFNAWMMVVDLRYIISIVTQQVIPSTWPRFEKQNPKFLLFQHYTQFAIEVCRG